MAPIRRVNSVAVSTARMAAVGKRLSQDDFVQMLVNCDYEPDQIVGIQYLPHRNIVIVKFKTHDQYKKFLGLEKVTINGVPCGLFDMSSDYTVVSVLGAPLEMEKEEISEILSRYGRVHSIRRRLLKCATNVHFNIVPDGAWLANMELNTPIPSFLIVRDAQIAFRYDGQQKTCRRCGSTNHLARDCMPQDFTHTPADPRDFPTLAEANPHPASGASQSGTSGTPLAPEEDQAIPMVTDLQESSVPEEIQASIDLDDSTIDSSKDTNNKGSTSITTPTPIIKVRAADAKHKPASNVASRNEKPLKGNGKNKKTPWSTAPTPSATSSATKMQLRQIRKRQPAPGTLEPTNEESDKEHEVPANNMDPPIEMDQNYLVTFSVNKQSDK